MQKKNIIVIGLAVGLGIMILVIIGAIHTVRTTGVLQVTISSPDAQIVVKRVNYQDQKLGKGNHTVRLQPGDYQVIATLGSAQTSAPTHIEKRQKTTAAITITQTTPPKSIITYSAQDIFANSDGVYFLNAPFQMPYNYPFGSDKALPYLADQTYPVVRLYWLDATHFFAQNSDGGWYYEAAGQASYLQPSNQPVVTQSISFNQKGMVAFVSEDYKVLALDSPSSSARQLDIFAGDKSSVKTSISNGGKVMVYTAPSINANKPVPPVIYSNQGKQTLPTSLDEADNVRWSPDDSAISYTTGHGVYLYTFATKQRVQLSAQSPNYPLSITWVSPSRIIYAQDKSIWSYDLKTKQSTKLTDIVGVLNNSQAFSLGPDGHTIYFGTSPNGNTDGGNIYSLPL